MNFCFPYQKHVVGQMPSDSYTLMDCLLFWSCKEVCLTMFAYIYKSLNVEYTVMMKLLKSDIITPIIVVLHYIMGRRYYMSSFETLKN